MPKILFVDPGKMTGYGFLYWGPGSGTDQPAFVGGEMAHDDFLDWVGRPQQIAAGRSFLEAWDLQSVVCEGFHVTAATAQKVRADEPLWSVEQRGCLRTWCRWANIPFITQMPSAMKFDESGSKLKKLGWWAPAPGVKGEAGHRRAAGKHAVKYAVDHRIIDPRILL